MSAPNDLVGTDADGNETGQPRDDGGDQDLDVLEGLPPEVKKKVTELTLSMMHSVGPVPNPLLGKISGEHISKVLELSDEYGKRAYRDTAWARFYMLVYVVLAIGLFIFLTLFLVKIDKALYTEVFMTIAAFLGGVGVGYGVKSHADKKEM